MITRRKVIVALGTGALVSPLNSYAQQPTKIRRIGYLSQRRVELVDTDASYGTFRQGLRDAGFVEGKNLSIEWRSAEGNYERLPALAAELVNLKVDVIVTPGTPATRAAHKATTSIPIVFINAGDPIGDGFIKSFARPAGNATGVTGFLEDLSQKRLEMLLAMVPKLSRVAVLVYPSNTISIKKLELVQAEAQRRGVTILRVDARTPQEIEQAFARMQQQNARALMVFRESFFTQQKSQIAELTARYRLPAMTEDRLHTEAGMLMSYGPRTGEQFYRAAYYVARILKGAKPADLPVELPTVYELVINGKSAKALGLTIPQGLLISTKEVIQ